MNNPRALIAIVSLAFVIAIGGIAGRAASAAGPPPVGLGTATSFALLAGAGITNTGTTTINGDVGTYPTTTETGFGSVTAVGTNHAGDAVTQGAKTDLVAAYNTAAGSGPPTPVIGDLGGQTLVAGVYNSSSSLGLTGALTLSGGPSDVWIFQAGSTLTTATGSSVVLIGGAQSCNIFWQIGSSATIGTGSAFKGTIIALTSITLTTGATVDGRVLARNGAVTLDTNTITRSDCQTTPTPPTRPPFTIAPGASPTPVPAPITTFTPAPSASPSLALTATPVATAAASVTPTTAATAATPVPSARTAAPASVAGLQRLPSTSTDPLGPLAILGLALTGIGVLLLVRRPIRHL